MGCYFLLQRIFLSRNQTQTQVSCFGGRFIIVWTIKEGPTDCLLAVNLNSYFILIYDNYKEGTKTIDYIFKIIYCSVQFSCSVMSDSSQYHGPQHTRLPCPLQTPRACSNLCPSHWWYHPTISSSVIPFSSRPQLFSESGSFPVSQFFTWGGQSIGVSVSASVLPMNIQDFFPLGWTCWISL